MKALYIDCSLAGVSGDMMLSALLNLGAELDLTRLSEAVRRSLPGVERLTLSYKVISKQGFQAGFLKVEIRDLRHSRTGVEIVNALDEVMELMDASLEAKSFARRVVNTILEAEGRVHLKPVEEVHLHEVGSPDTLVDIAGVSLAMEQLNLLRSVKVYGSPVAVGSGAFKTEHGILVSPAPATLEILRSRGYPFKGGPVEGELATPTGVAILSVLVEEPVSIPPFIKPVKVGYGAGLRDLPGVPNVLRIIYGEGQPLYAADEVYVVETNLDDVDGEVLGYAVERIMKEGARDVSIIPTTAKKGRPGCILKVIVDCERLNQVVERIFTETGTLGVRIAQTRRLIAPREVKELKIKLMGVESPVRIKVAKNLEGRVLRIKPEHEDLRRISRETGLPVRVLSSLVLEKARRAFEGSDRL